MIEVGTEIWVVRSQYRTGHMLEILITPAWIAASPAGYIRFEFIDEHDPTRTVLGVVDIEDGQGWLMQEGMTWARRTEEKKRALLAALALS